jgi:hypothetical protein
MKDELKSPPSEIDSAAGQHAKRGGSAFAKATARQVRSRHLCREKAQKTQNRGINYGRHYAVVRRGPGEGFAIHRYHKHGHLEKVYENALAHRLRKLGLDVKQQLSTQSL